MIILQKIQLFLNFFTIKLEHLRYYIINEIRFKHFKNFSIGSKMKASNVTRPNLFNSKLDIYDVSNILGTEKLNKTLDFLNADPGSVKIESLEGCPSKLQGGIESLEGCPENLVVLVNCKITELADGSDKIKTFEQQQIESSRRTSEFFEKLNEHQDGKFISMLKSICSKIK